MQVKVAQSFKFRFILITKVWDKKINKLCVINSVFTIATLQQKDTAAWLVTVAKSGKKPWFGLLLFWLSEIFCIYGMPMFGLSLKSVLVADSWW